MIFDNPRITNFQNFEGQVLDGINTSRDKRGKINLEHILEDQDINTSNSNHGPVDPMLGQKMNYVFDNNWIPW